MEILPTSERLFCDSFFGVVFYLLRTFYTIL
nr:MAG TPA: hypothetical protein [Caudoviricetes sp.]